MRRRPCWSCARPTPLGELVETHLDDGQPGRSGLVAERRPGHLAVPALRRQLRTPTRPHAHQER
jgi:hypothetical protein